MNRENNLPSCKQFKVLFLEAYFDFTYETLAEE